MEEVLVAFPRNEAFVQEKIAEDAFTDIFNRYYNRVFNYMHFRLGNLYEAEELSSQVFEHVLQKMSTYNPELAPFEVWLFAVARNIINDHYRRQKRWSWLPLESIKNLVSRLPSPEENALKNEEHRLLLSSLASLDDRQRNIIALKFAGGFKNREIAQLTGLSESNVGVLIYRSLNQLRELLKNKE